MNKLPSYLTKFWSLASLATAGLLGASAQSSAWAAGAQAERIPIWPGQAPVSEGVTDTNNAYITIHRPAKANGAAMIICPGGGYGQLVAGPEGHGIAAWLNHHGVVGIVLEYRLPKGRPFVPLSDAQRAIRLVRSRAKEWDIDPQRIGIIGFSAGGHLAATAVTHFDNGNPQAAEAVEKVGCRPDFGILVYPVITMGPLGHGGSKANLLGKNPSADLVKLFSNEEQVTAQTPPCFLAHAQDDTVVPPDNSRMFFQALQANKVESQYLELPSGGHGLNHYSGLMWDDWQKQSLEWLAAQKFIPAADAETPARPMK